MLNVSFYRCLIYAYAAYEVTWRSNNVFLPIYFRQPFETSAQMRRRLAFQAPHHIRNTILGRNDHYQVQMILIKANRLKFHARHTSKQLRQYTSQVLTKTRIQDPTAVFAHPNHIHPRVNPWCSVFDRINGRPVWKKRL